MAAGIGLDRLQELLTAGAQLVEVLPEAEYSQAHLPGAINLPLGKLHEQNLRVLDRRRAVVVYCWDSL
jgi:rhodanese-related sulfurtransferase